MFVLTIMILGLNFKQKEVYMSEKTSWLLECIKMTILRDNGKNRFFFNRIVGRALQFRK